MKKAFAVSLLVLIVLVAAVFVSSLCAQCGPGGCAVGNRGYQWQQAKDDPDCWALLLYGIQIGGWRQSTGVYRPYFVGEWGGIEKPPIAPPAVAKAKKSCNCCGDNCRCADGRPCGRPDCSCILPGATIESDGRINFGLNCAAIKKDKRHVNGFEVTKDQLLKALAAPTMPDDSAELCLTVIGSDTERKQVLADLDASAELQPWKGKLKIKGYTPDHWAVKDCGFITSGHPTIYCQAPSGKVLHRQNEYAGPTALAEALRKADGSYQPAKDPDLTKTLSLPSLATIETELAKVPVWVWLAIAFVLYLRFVHKGTKS